MKPWAGQPGDADVQEAAATLASINFDASRIDDLTYGELESMMKGVMVLVQRHMKQISMRSVRLIAEAAKRSDDVEALMKAVGAMLDEKVVQRQLRMYARGRGGE